MNGAIRILRIAQRLRKNPYAVKPKPHSEHLQLLDPGTGFFPIHDGNSSPTRSRYCPANSSRVISDLSRRSLSCCTTSLGAFSKKPALSSLPLGRFKSTLIFLILVSNRSRSLSTSTRPVRSRKARNEAGRVYLLQEEEGRAEALQSQADSFRQLLSLIHIGRCRRIERCRSRW